VQVLAEAKYRDMYLLIVGDGPDAIEVQRAASELGVADRVKMLGHVTERQKHAALSMSDIFVSTSQHEGFGLVFLEAMACGLPVVAYDRGGQIDFLSASTGGVIRLNDVHGFTQAVLDLHASPERRAEIRRHNLAAIETYFIDRCARRYEAIFERAIMARAGSLAPARQK
jgi:glycosyltransferase involved in cell wall biosynthesis